MAKTALVTGAYGFIGRHVARQLAREGLRVIGIGHVVWVYKKLGYHTTALGRIRLWEKN